MLKLTFLGTSNAVPDINHDNTHLVIAVGTEHRAGERLVMIDCGSSPLVRLTLAGMDVNYVSDLILTHFHPDHMAGAPSLLMQSWLVGRQAPLHVHCLGHVLERLVQLLDFYSWTHWPEMYPVDFHEIPEGDLVPVIEDGDLRVLAAPVCHMIPNIGLRIESPETGAALAYSCDTEPCETVVRLAAGADHLIHESTGALHGHTSASKAGEIAQLAQAKQLYLVHYNPRLPRLEELVEEARQTFSGPVTLAQDFMAIDF
jgi:ribonuclease Z